jgi:hypothetical protein
MGELNVNINIFSMLVELSYFSPNYLSLFGLMLPLSLIMSLLLYLIISVLINCYMIPYLICLKLRFLVHYALHLLYKIIEPSYLVEQESLSFLVMQLALRGLSCRFISRYWFCHRIVYAGWIFLCALMVFESYLSTLIFYFPPLFCLII